MKDRNFTTLLPASVTGALAAAATLLDDAGLRPDDLLTGVTVVTCGDDYVSDAVSHLVGLAVPQKKVARNRAVQDGDLVVVDDDFGSFPLAVFDNALGAGKPVVLVGPVDWLPDDIDTHLDRRAAIPDRLTDDQLARVAILVAGSAAVGCVLDVAGLGASVTVTDVVKAVRVGQAPAAGVDRLRKIAAHRAAAVVVADAAAAAAVVDALAAAAAPSAPTSPPPVKLADLSGYGAAKTWGLQLASDIADYRAGRLSWDDVDRGVLLSGPPGCGKTFFARALAAQCDVQLFPTAYSDWHTAGSGDTVQKSLSKLYKTWRDAALSGPIIVFVDEFDSIGKRGTSDNHSYWFGPIIDSWLAFLDGADPRTNIVVIAATNFADRIDDALKRPGRLERHVEIPYPTVGDLAGVVRHHAGDIADARAAAVACRGRSPADVALLVRDARRVARRARRPLTAGDIVDAAKAALPVRTPADDANTVAHEAGHALVAVALGVHVHYVDADAERNRLRFPGTPTRAQVDDFLAVLLAGRAATELFDCGADAGAADDLMQATSLAVSAIAKFGLGDSLVVLPDSVAAGDLGVRDRVASILDGALVRARAILTEREGAFRRLASALQRHRYLDADEIRLAIESPIARLARQQREASNEFGDVDDLVA